MRTPPPSRKLSKLEIAVAHIHSALVLQSNIELEPSVLHLAAAADEIIEAMLKRDGKPTLSHQMLIAIQKYAPHFDRRTFYRVSTKSKNAVKHADFPKEDIVDLQLGAGSFALVRAIMNYETLAGDITDQMRQYMDTVQS